MDRLNFNLRGPAGLYELLTQTRLDQEELKLSLSRVENCPEYKIILPLQPFQRTEIQKDIIEQAFHSVLYASNQTTLERLTLK